VGGVHIKKGLDDRASGQQSEGCVDLLASASVFLVDAEDPSETYPSLDLVKVNHFLGGLVELACKLRCSLRGVGVSRPSLDEKLERGDGETGQLVVVPLGGVVGGRQPFVESGGWLAIAAVERLEVVGECGDRKIASTDEGDCRGAERLLALLIASRGEGYTMPEHMIYGAVVPRGVFDRCVGLGAKKDAARGRIEAGCGDDHSPICRGCGRAR
jgi:predicted Fe-S protein YdhL (DUF1289 family)